MSVLMCILIADFLTGLFHWFEDTYGDPGFPILGPLVFEPNLLHHEQPMKFTMSGFCLRNYQSWLIAAATCSVVYLLGVFSWHVALVGFLAGMGNEVHVWTHKRGPCWIRLLQEMGIIQHPRQHAKHHKAPFDSHFCTLTNAMNPVLELVHFWRGLEWVISLFGFPTKRMSESRRGL